LKKSRDKVIGRDQLLGKAMTKFLNASNYLITNVAGRFPANAVVDKAFN
jgi:hypothetical protein